MGRGDICFKRDDTIPLQYLGTRMGRVCNSYEVCRGIVKRPIVKQKEMGRHGTGRIVPGFGDLYVCAAPKRQHGPKGNGLQI